MEDGVSFWEENGNSQRRIEYLERWADKYDFESQMHVILSTRECVSETKAQMIENVYAYAYKDVNKLIKDF